MSYKNLMSVLSLAGTFSFIFVLISDGDNITGLLSSGVFMLAILILFAIEVVRDAVQVDVNVTVESGDVTCLHNGEELS